MKINKKLLFFFLIVLLLISANYVLVFFYPDFFSSKVENNESQFNKVLNKLALKECPLCPTCTECQECPTCEVSEENVNGKVVNTIDNALVEPESEDEVWDDYNYEECEMFAKVMELETLPWRFSCGIESVARLYSDKTVCLFHDEYYKDDIYDVFPNVKLKRIDYNKIFENSPGEFYWKRGLYKNTKPQWVLKELSDAVKLTILYKIDGGIFFDLDMVFIKKLKEMDQKDHLAAQFDQRSNPGYVSSGFYSFRRNSYFMQFATSAMVGHFNNDKAKIPSGSFDHAWGINGFNLITYVYNQLTAKHKKDEIRLHPRKVFYYWGYKDGRTKFVMDVVNDEKNRREYEAMLKYSQAVHFWRLTFEEHEEKRGQETGVADKIGYDSLVSQVYKTYCPNAYELRLVPRIEQNVNSVTDSEEVQS